MKRLLLILLLSCLFPLKVFCNDSFPYTKVIYFGDSLTDDGNLYKALFHIIPKSPPYYEGRFSNGIVWSEYLTTYLKTNYPYVSFENDAVGGETVLPHKISEGHLPWTLDQSINNYFKRKNTDNSTTLYFVWIGANDYNGGSTDPDELTSEVVNQIHYSIEQLINHGAKHFIILNLPDLSRTPAAKLNNMESILYTLTVLHNSKLAGAMFQLQMQYPNVAIRMFDIFGLFNDLIDHTAAVNQKFNTHIKDTSSSCWAGGYTIRRSTMTEENPDLSAAYEVGKNYENGMVPCSNPDELLFWDKVHPTAVTQEILAKTIEQFVFYR